MTKQSKNDQLARNYLRCNTEDDVDFWYYVDETGLRVGPFETRDEALKELKTYLKDHAS